MSKTFFALAVCTLTLGLSAPLSAQTELYLALTSPQNVVDDVNAILDLTSPEEQEQKAVLTDYFNLLLEGVETTAPFKLDVLSEPEAARYRIFFPVTRRTRDFRENLKGYSFISRRDRDDPALYIITGEYDGYLKFDTPYAILVKSLEDLQSIQTAAANAFSKHAQLSDQPEVDVILSLDNEGGDVEQRHKDFGGIEAILKSYVTRKEGESAKDFAVREATADLLIAELERIYAESSSMLTTWSLPVPVEKGTFTTNVEPIPETSLAATVNELKATPSQFAGIPQNEDAILKMRAQLPIDDMRKQNLTKFNAVMKSSFDASISEGEEHTAEQKTAYDQASNLFFEMLNKTAESGWFDMIAQVYNNDQGRVSLGAMNSVNGEEARKILELIPKTAPGRTVEFDVDKQGDVAIHKVELEEGALESLQGFFGEEVIFYVGTTEKAFWITAGANALEELKNAINLAAAGPAEASESKTFVDLKLAVGSWVETAHKVRGESGNEKLYNFAKESFKDGADAITFELNQNGENIDGVLNVQQGVLRLAGKLAADFSAENLEE